MNNDTKLDRVILLLEGGKDAPGVVGRLARTEEILFGDTRFMGVLTKVNIMWRLHIWLLCTMSALAGYALKTLAINNHWFASVMSALSL